MPKGTSPALIPSLQHVRTRFAVEPLEGRRLLSAAVVLLEGNRLRSFDTDTPASTQNNALITGLAAGESILAIDYRPATGGLYGLGSGSRLYSIDFETGAAIQVGSDFAIPLEGNSFDLDFNPAVDRIRIVSNTDQNLRVNPDTGAVVDADLVTSGVQIDGELAFASGDANDGDDPVIVAAAYTKNVFAGSGTTLYALDSAADSLVSIGSVGGTPTSPNTGQISTVGALGVNIGKRSGLDIRTVGATDTAVALLQVVGQDTPQVYNINLTTGAATLVGSIGVTAIDFAIAPPPAIAIALTTNNELLVFDANDPTNILRRTKIRGLFTEKEIRAIDFRPADGLLYAMDDAEQLYTINPKTGRTVTLGNQTVGITVVGSSFGFDVNPAADRIRLVTDEDFNVRFNPNTGGVVDADDTMAGPQSDADLAYDAADANAAANPFVTASAYTGNDTDAATPTTLYGIDTELNTLVRQGSDNGAPVSPNTGTLFTVGSLGLNVTSRTGFDISTADGTDSAFAATQLIGQSRAGIYRINLTTGAASRIGSIGGNRTIAGLAMV